MTYICTYAYESKKDRSYLEFKLYKQDNISHDTGQIFAVTFFLRKNNTYVNITNIIVL